MSSAASIDLGTAVTNPVEYMCGHDVECELELTMEEAYYGGQNTLQFSFRERCQACGGTGPKNQRICRSCGGTGSITTVNILGVEIPAFTREGTRIRLKGQSGEGPANGKQGDLVLTVRIMPHRLDR